MWLVPALSSMYRFSMTNSSKKFSLVLVSSVVAIGILSAPMAFSASSSAAKAGGACAKLGAVAKTKTASFKCVKSGSKFVWRVVKTAKPAPAKSTPAAAASSTPTPAVSLLPAQSAYDITVAAHQWSFNFTYFVNGKSSPLASASGDSAVLYVPEGKLVHFSLTSADTTHGFWIPDLLINSSMDPGTTGHLDFTASKLGTFIGRCNVPSCGRGHAGMAFTVKVVSQDDYLKYLSSLK